MTDDERKHFNQYFAHLALVGLLETLLNPPCPKLFFEAHRIIFNIETVEFKTIADFLETDPKALQEKAFACLTEKGFPVNVETKH